MFPHWGAYLVGKGIIYPLGAPSKRGDSRENPEGISINSGNLEGIPEESRASRKTEPARAWRRTLRDSPNPGSPSESPERLQIWPRSRL